MRSEAVATSRVQVWDAPVRIAHWLMVLLIATSWWTAENGQLDYHRYSGYTLLWLLVFRLYWGIAGSETARFTHFIKGPRAIVRYLKQLPQRVSEHAPATPGHNPLGALSVLALLALLIAQVTLGLFAVDVDGIESGPLSHLVSFDTGRACAEVHETLFNVLLAFIALHIAAVLFYLLYKRDNLIAAMVHGKRELSPGARAPDTRVSVVRFVIGAAIASAVVWWIVRNG